MQDEMTGLLELGRQQGHFLLESGHHGDLWLDLDSLFLEPTKVLAGATALAARLAAHSLDGVCGPLIGGAFVAEFVAWRLNIEFYYAERHASESSEQLYGVSYLLPSSQRKRVHGKAIGIVDDVINAGSAIRATLAELRACGAEVPVISALLTLGEEATRFTTAEDVALERLIAFPNNLWLPSECPLCAARVPLTPVPD